MRQHPEQAVQVTRLRREHDTTPEPVDADRTNALVTRMRHAFQVLTRVPVVLELLDRTLGGALYGLLQLGVFGEKLPGDRQSLRDRHRRPLPIEITVSRRYQRAVLVSRLRMVFSFCLIRFSGLSRNMSGPRPDSVVLWKPAQ